MNEGYVVRSGLLCLTRKLPSEFLGIMVFVRPLVDLKSPDNGASVQEVVVDLRPAGSPEAALTGPS